MGIKSLILALVLGLFVPTLCSCSEEARTQREYKRSEQKRKKAMKEVGERSDAYMNSIRWRDYQSASTYYEAVEDQLSYLRGAVDGVGQPTIDSISVDFVLVDEEAERAEVRVTLSEVEYASQRLQTRSQTLLWYLSDLNKPKQWYLVPVVTVEPE